MRNAARPIALLALGWCLGAANAVAAPIFQCSNGAWSNQRCTQEAPSLRVYGPAAERPQTWRGPAVYGGRLPPPVAHIDDLSPECQRMSEAMRTAPARGVGNEVVADLRREWAVKCQDDDTEARQKYQARLREKRDSVRAARESTNATLAAEKTESSRCQSMYALLRERRTRLATMNAAEQGEFQAFETNVRARCPAH